MSRESALAKNTLILALGTFLPRFISLLTTPIITLCTQGQDYGYVSILSSTILSFVVPIATLQLEQAFFRFLINAKTDEEKAAVLSSGMAVVFGIMVVVTLGCIFLPFFSFEGWELVLIIAYILIEMMCQIMRFVLRAFGMFKEYSFLAALVVVVNFVTLVLCLAVFKIGYLGVLVALATADFVGICYSTYKTKFFKYISLKHYSFETTKELLFYSFPFIPNAIAAYVNVLSDQWIISAVLGFSSNAIYVIALKVPSILSLIYPTFNTAWTESVLRNFDDEDSSEYYQKMFRTMFCLLSASCACLIAVSPIIFFMLNQNPELNEGVKYAPILVIGTYLTCFGQFFSGIYIGLKKSRELMYSTGLAAIVNVILNLIFVQYFGIIAAVLATLTSNGVLAGYRFIDINRNHYRMRIPRRLTIFTIIMLAIFVSLSVYGTVVTIGINIVLAIVFSYIIAGDIILGMLKSVLRKFKRA